MKIFASLCLAIWLTAAPVQAQGIGGPNQDVRQVSAIELSGLADASQVLLIGHIERKIGTGKYRFSDDTGTATLEINDDFWRNMTVAPAELVEIKGEVDQNRRGKPEVKVKKIIKLDRHAGQGPELAAFTNKTDKKHSGLFDVPGRSKP